MNRTMWRISIGWVMFAVLMGPPAWLIFAGCVLVVLIDVLLPPDERTARRLGL